VSSSTIAFDIIARDRASSTFGKFAKAAAGALGAIGVGAFIKSAVTLEAQFGQTMSMIAATTKAPADQMQAMNDLAIKLGADTAFSAGEAADAMLELAKAGLTTKTIMGGGVAGTLTLAAAGGTDLATAATIASNALNTFNLKGRDMAKVAAALAGGANASSASVESLGMGLQQVGPGATNAGLSLQETVAVLSAFEAAGIKGSDAGTSLKTMLARLVPTTDKAKNAMRELGLDFVDANGNFKSISNISDQLREKMGKLGQAERTKAMNTIFGSDATRAATVLMHEGEKGLGKYIKATKDQSAAQDMANARMSGTAGALERLKGSVETAQLLVGQALAPAVQKVANALADNLVPAMATTIQVIGTVVGFMQDHQTTTIALAAAIGALVAITQIHAAVMTVAAAGGILKYLQATKIVTAATKVWTAVQWALNASFWANPITLVVVGIAALAAGVVYAYTRFEGFRKVVDATFSFLKSAVTTVIGFVKDHWALLLPIIMGPVGLAAVLIIKNFDKVKAGFQTLWDVAQKVFKGIGAVATWLWNNAIQPVFSMIIGVVANLMAMWAKMLGALSKVPGFGWAKDAAAAMGAAAAKAQAIADNINKIPNHVTKYVDIVVHTTRTGPGGTGGEYPDAGTANRSGRTAGVTAPRMVGRSAGMPTGDRLLARAVDLLERMESNQRAGVNAGQGSYLLGADF